MAGQPTKTIQFVFTVRPDRLADNMSRRAAQIFQQKIEKLFTRQSDPGSIHSNKRDFRSSQQGVIKADGKNFYFEATTSEEIVKKLRTFEQSGRLLLMANSLGLTFEQMALKDPYNSDDDAAMISSLNSFENVQVCEVDPAEGQRILRTIQLEKENAKHKAHIATLEARLKQLEENLVPDRPAKKAQH